jgi:hypothetical protein
MIGHKGISKRQTAVHNKKLAREAYLAWIPDDVARSLSWVVRKTSVANIIDGINGPCYTIGKVHHTAFVRELFLNLDRDDQKKIMDLAIAQEKMFVAREESRTKTIIRKRGAR